MAYNKIALDSEYIRIEGNCDDAGGILPGALLQDTSTGLKKNVGECLPCAKIFAIEDSLQGKLTTDAYAHDNPVQAIIARPGCRVNALVTGNIAVGDLLVSDGAGGLREYGESTDDYSGVIAVALEADVDASGSLVKVRVL